jgi:hypothetical protein
MPILGIGGMKKAYISLLRRHIRRTNNPDSGVHQKQRQYLPMSLFRLIRQLKRLNLMLQYIRESEESTFFAENRANFLNSCFVVSASEDFFEPAVNALRVGHIMGVVCSGLLAKS